MVKKKTDIKKYYNERVKTAINKLINLYFKNPFRIFSESDMKCWLFYFLKGSKEYSTNEDKNNKDTSYHIYPKTKTYHVHSETHVGGNSWVDVYIFEAQIIFKRNRKTAFGKLKGWSFENKYKKFDIGIELKYNYSGSEEDVRKKIVKDRNKFSKSMINDQYFIVFDHRGTIKSQRKFSSFFKKGKAKKIKALYVDGFRGKIYHHKLKISKPKLGKILKENLSIKQD